MIHKLLNSYMDASMVADSGEVTALMYARRCMYGSDVVADGEIRLSQSCLATLRNINSGKTIIACMNYQIYL